MLKALGAWLKEVATARPWWWVLFAINLAGTVYGMYWYWDQLAVTPVYLWLFTPDCPLASLYFTVTLASGWLGCGAAGSRPLPL